MKFFAVIVVLFVVAGSWAGGLEPASFAGSHLLSTIQGPSSEEAGRGGAGVAVDHPYGGNPAAVPAAQSVAAMAMVTSFPNGLDVQLMSGKVTIPIGRRTGLMLNCARQSSSSGILTGSPYGIDIDATNFTVSVSRRINNRLKMGVALAPEMETGLHLTGDGSVLAEISSDERYGARVGFLYEAGYNITLGGYYDNYVESVSEMSGLYRKESNFRSEAIRLGIAYQTGPWLIALDHFHAKVSGAANSMSLGQWLVGADYRLDEQWIARSGYWDGGWSFGTGFDKGGWSANLAYVHNIWGSQFDTQMGGSGSDTWSLGLAKSW